MREDPGMDSGKLDVMTAFEQISLQAEAEECGGLFEAVAVEDLTEPSSMTFDEDLLSAGSPAENAGELEDGFEDYRLGAVQSREVAFGLGLSFGVHACALILSMVMTLFFKADPIPEAQYVTVSLIGLAASGGGEEGDREGSGGGSADMIGEAPAPLSSEPASEGAEVEQSAMQETEAPEHAAEIEQVETGLHMALQPMPEIGKPPEVKLKPLEPKKKKVAAIAPKTVNNNSRKKRAKPAASQSPATELQSQSEPSACNVGASGGGGGPPGAAGDGAAGSGAGNGGNSSATGTGGGAFPKELDFRQVDTPPAPIRKVEPEFPLEARRMGIAGKVVLKLLVKKDGSVDKASVIDAAPKGIFEDSALEAIKKWKFSPGRYRGDAVATWVLQPIQFRLFR